MCLLRSGTRLDRACPHAPLCHAIRLTSGCAPLQFPQLLSLQQFRSTRLVRRNCSQTISTASVNIYYSSGVRDQTRYRLCPKNAAHASMFAMKYDLNTLKNHIPNPNEHAVGEPPQLTIIAGASGVGKSTFIRALTASKFYLGPCITADKIPNFALRGIPHQLTDSSCYRLNDSLRETLIRSRVTFLTETTLSDSHHRRLRMIQLAKAMGYTISLVFLFSMDTEQVLARRRYRNAAHDRTATAGKVRAQQDRALKNFHTASKHVFSILEVDVDSGQYAALSRHSNECATNLAVLC